MSGEDGCPWVAGTDPPTLYCEPPDKVDVIGDLHPPVSE
jgi:hypothetical protein